MDPVWNDYDKLSVNFLQILSQKSNSHKVGGYLVYAKNYCGSNQYGPLKLSSRVGNNMSPRPWVSPLRLSGTWDA